MQDKHRTWLAVAAIISLAVALVPTAAEFIVALHNRYSVYPPGTDTDMLSNTILAKGILSVVVVVLCGYILGILRKRAAILLPIGVIILFVLSEVVPTYIPHDWCKYELRIYSCADTTIIQY